MLANWFILHSAVRLASKNVLVRQLVDKVDLNHVDDEPFELTQEIEAQVIGNLLPDDDDRRVLGRHRLAYAAAAMSARCPLQACSVSVNVGRTSSGKVRRANSTAIAGGNPLYTARSPALMQIR